LRFIDVVLDPGDAEFVHFYRGEFGCDEPVDSIRQLTAIREGTHTLRLRWEEIDNAQAYVVYGSQNYGGPFAPIGLTDATTYIDSTFTCYQNYFYEVKACAEFTGRPEQ
jgi:hypothetical protein